MPDFRVKQPVVKFILPIRRAQPPDARPDSRRVMTEASIKSNFIALYAYATSPEAAKVNCFLDYKGLEFNIIYVDPLTRRELGFTRQSQVPVLKIGSDWKFGATPIGIWLEERFPARPILGRSPAQRELILDLDRWVGASLSGSLRRQLEDWDSVFSGLYNGWRLGAVAHRARALPLAVRLLWPLLLRVGSSEKRLVGDRTETLPAMRERVCRELTERLEQGPFLGGLEEPSLADLAAYPHLIMPYVIGLKRDPTFLRFPRVLGWMIRVQSRLPAHPLLVPPECLKRPLPYSV